MPRSHVPASTAVLVSATLLLLQPLSSSRAWAWGSLGHALVGEIAERHLSPAARHQLDELTGGKRLSDPEVADWADRQRRHERATESWHYVNVPISADAYMPARDCPHRDCVVEKITDFAAILEDPASDVMLRAEALRFLVHLVADLHQPLHCGDAGDRGGNELRVHYRNRDPSQSLHSVWDTALIEELVGAQSVAEAAQRIDRATSMKIATDLRLSTSPGVWANEAHDLARQVYRDIPRAENDDLPVLRERYINANRAVVELQLERAGVRLAALLNRLLSIAANAPAARATDAVR